MTPKFWWYATRSTGIVAWALAAGAVLWGLLLSTRAAKGLAKPVWLLDLHRFLGALTVVAVLAHMGALVGDSFVHFGRADLLVPGATQWRTTAVAFGIVAFWLLLLVEVTSLLRKKLPNKVWSRIHLTSFIAYVLATIHYLQAGTERTNPALLLTVEITSAAILGLTVFRILTPRRPKRRVVVPRSA